MPLTEFRLSKPERQAAILDLVRTRPVSSQEELRVLLAAQGVEVTQATLSRDLRDIGLARVTTEDGIRYVLPESLGDEESPSLEVLLPQLFLSVDGVNELAVLRTRPSGAQPIAEAIDAEVWPEILGTIGGENTVLIICRSLEARTAVSDRLRRLAGR
jgi:transcriptional regulator of arginine metabolism